MPSLRTVQGVPRDGMFVPRDTFPGTGYVVPMDGEDRTGRERKERLRARRDEAGMAQVSGWVPKDRRSYAREVLAALARGANHLPPDPEQVAALDAALDAAQADATAARSAEMAARAALTEAEQRRQVLAAELDAARAEGEAARESGRQAEAAAVARAETAEQARGAIMGELRAAEAAAAQARAEAERFQEMPGLRGRVVRWLAVTQNDKR